MVSYVVIFLSGDYGAMLILAKALNFLMSQSATSKTSHGQFVNVTRPILTSIFYTLEWFVGFDTKVEIESTL